LLDISAGVASFEPRRSIAFPRSTFRSVLPPDSHQTAWFFEHLQPHDAMLRAWLRSRFPALSDLDDVMQEAYSRVLQAKETTSIAAPKAFLFATARNVVLARIRHQNTPFGGPRLVDIETESVLDESADVPHAVGRAEEFELLTKAIQSLPTRCRQVITLRKIYGLSQKEVAARLGIAERTVEAQGTIGLRKLAAFFEHIERADRGGA
jgi:RNA polymerase sigma factor (sigma-70 family)